MFEVTEDVRGRLLRDREGLAAAWGDLMTRYMWDGFFTGTYRRAVRAFEKVEKDVGRFFFLWAELTLAQVPGRLRYRWKLDQTGRKVWVLTSGSKREVTRCMPVYVLGVERHKSGLLHCHAVYRGADRCPELFRRDGWALWYRLHGGNKIEPPECQEAVRRYVAKYIVKDGDIVLSESFDAALMDAVGNPRSSVSRAC